MNEAIKTKRRKRIQGKEYAGSMRGTTTNRMTAIRLATALLLIWTLQFGIVLWFMIGQGYDRATATQIPWAGVLLLPIFGLLVRSGLPRVDGSRVKKVGIALVQAAGLYLGGVLVPGWVILHGLLLTSPFDELWWMLGASTILIWGLLVMLKSPKDRRTLYAVLLFLGSAAALPGWRLFVLAFFR